MLVICESDIEALIDIDEAIASAREAYRLAASGEAGASARADLRSEAPKAGCLVLAGLHGAAGLVVKSNVHAWPDGPEAPRLWGSLLTLWDLETCLPRALISARAFNEHRTAAGFAAAAARLAPASARTLAVFGAGKSAPWAIRYLRQVRPSIARLVLVGRSPDRVARLARAVATWPDLAGIGVETGLSPADAAREADIIVTVTTSDSPVFPGEAVRDGSLVVLGGANRPTAREADDALMRHAIVFVDSLAGALAKAGDLALPLASGVLARARIAGEIGACLEGPSPLADAPHAPLVFKSIGLAEQDAALATRLIARAETLGRGTRVPLLAAGDAA
jgi:ornithine cyclodeaminase